MPVGSKLIQPGAVLQVQSTTTTAVFSSSSSGFVDVTGLSVNITPQYTSSKILILATIYGGSASNNVQINLVRNSTNIAQSVGSTGNGTGLFAFPGGYQSATTPINFLDSPATISAITYKIQINPTGGLVYVNTRATDVYYGGVSTITVMEIGG
jgi:hypothetical protein